MKKVISLIILILLLFTLISCGQKEFVFEEDSEINFLGNTFTVYSTVSLVSENRTRGASASGDRFLDRIEQIEKDYNVKIKNVLCGENLQTTILSITLNGGGGCDLLYCGDDSLYAFYELGILTPFEEIGVKDHSSEKFGIPSLLFQGNFNGTQYGVLNYFGDSIPSVSGLLTLNNDQFERLSVTDPHEYVEKGEWNWENFRSELIKGTYVDGELKHVGMICETMLGGLYGFMPAIISNNGYLIKQVDGIYKSGLTEENTTEAIEFITELTNEGFIEMVMGGTWGHWFEDGNWLFLSYLNSVATGNSSIVRFPYGPSGNKDIVAGFSLNRNYYAFSILASFSNDEIGIIVDDLFEPLAPSLYPDGWKDYAIENNFLSDSDYETYLLALNTTHFYPLGILYGTNQWSQSGVVETAFYNILKGLGSIQGEINSVDDIFTDLINEKLNGIK